MNPPDKISIPNGNSRNHAPNGSASIESGPQTEPLIRDYNILHLTISKDRFKLEKGILKLGTVQYSPISENNLHIEFTPELLEEPDVLAEFIELLKSEIEKYVYEGISLALVLPSELGFLQEVSNLRNLPEEEFLHHLAWIMKIYGWDDAEPICYSYKALDEDRVLAVAVRQRVVDFAQAISQNLSCKLIQLSLSDATDINILFQELVKELEEPSYRAKKSLALIVLPLLVVLLGAGSYYLFTYQKFNFSQIKPFVLSLKEKLSPPPKPVEIKPTQPETTTVAFKESTTAVPAETGQVQPIPVAVVDTAQKIPSKPAPVPPVSPAPIPTKKGAYAGLFDILTAKTTLKYLSITEGLVRCEIAVSSPNRFNEIVNEINNSHFAESASLIEYTSADKLSAIIGCQIPDDSLKKFTHPQEALVKSQLRASGFNIVDNLFSGEIRKISELIYLIDQRRFLFYRISLVEVNPKQYMLRLEY